MSIENATLGEVYHCILVESGIGLLEGTYISMPSLLVQLEKLGDPRVQDYRKKSSRRRNLESRLQMVSGSQRKIIRIDDSVFDRNVKWTTNPWYTPLDSSYFHTFSFGEAYSLVLDENGTNPFDNGSVNKNGKEWDEFPIDELVNWQDSQGGNQSCHEDLVKLRESICSRAQRKSIRDKLLRIQRGCQIFLGLPSSWKDEFFDAIHDVSTRIANLSHLFWKSFCWSNGGSALCLATRHRN